MYQTIFLQADASGLMSMLPFIAMIGVLYFFMIRPQMTKAKKEKNISSNNKKRNKNSNH